jgi:hypothetical protein
MTEALAEEIINFILNLRENGIREEEEISKELMNKYKCTKDDCRHILEMISTGSFRAGMISGGLSLPTSNLKVEDDIFLKTAFRMYWIETKGEAHYNENYLKTRPWWKFWK